MSNHATTAAIVTADEAANKYHRANHAEARGDRANAQRLRLQARDCYRAAEWCHRTEARNLRRPENATESNRKEADRHDQRADNYGYQAEAITGEMIAAGRVFG